MIIIIIRSKRVYGLFLGYFALFTGVQVQAAEIDTPVAVSAVSAEDIRELPSISVDAILPDDIRYTPGAATILTSEEIEELRPYTLHDAFDFMPGLRTIDDDVLGRRSGIGVRGAPSRRSRKTLLLEDGVPINASTYIDPSAHYTPPMERLESVDVLKGAGHVLHGPLNNHGIVNFRNKQPTAVPETTIELSGGMNDTFKRHLMHRRTAGPLGMVFSYTGANADGVFDIEETQYDDFFGSLDWNVNSQHNLGVSMLYFRERSDGYDESNLTPAEFNINPFRKRNRFGQEFNNFNLDYFKVDLKHDFQITSNFSTSTRLFLTDLERARFTVEPDEVELVDDGNGNPIPDFSTIDPDFLFVPGVSGIMKGRDREYRTYGAENRMELANIEALGANHTFQWGLRFERHFLDNREPVGAQGEVLDWDNQGNLGFIEPVTGEGSALETFQASAVSGFIQDAVLIGDWTVTPGVRVEHYTQNKNIKEEDGVPEFDKEEDEHTLLLPSISFLYSGFDHTQVFANVARGYTPAFARTAAEFPLQPETGINSQIGFRSNVIKGVSMEAATFYNIIQDTVVQLPFTVDGNNVVLNAADSISYGVDLGLRFDSAAYTGSPYNFFAQAAYSYVRAEFTEDGVDDLGNPVALDGNRVPEIPEHAGSLTLGVEHTSGWEASATVSHFGSFFTDPLNTGPLTLADEDREPVVIGDDLEIREPAVLGEVSSHTLLSARASYKLPGTNTTFWIQGRNLTDRLYIVDLENGVRPGAERTIVGGVHITF